MRDQHHRPGVHLIARLTDTITALSDLPVSSPIARTKKKSGARPVIGAKLVFLLIIGGMIDYITTQETPFFTRRFTMLKTGGEYVKLQQR
jgi:hypothetical protein